MKECYEREGEIELYRKGDKARDKERKRQKRRERKRVKRVRER